MRTRTAVLAAAVAVLGGATPAVAAEAPRTQRVSVSNHEAQGAGESSDPSISADGRYVAFTSDAANLVPGDGNGDRDVFVRDRTAGTTVRVSVSSGGKGGNSYSAGTSISADGRYVLFISDASNLVPGDTNSTLDVFVRDRQAKTTRRVSVASGGRQSNGLSGEAEISADGRYVVFTSQATNLVPGDTNEADDVFRHDLRTGVTRRVSVDTGGGQADDSSSAPVVSADGRIVAFVSEAPLAGGAPRITDVYVHDMRTGRITQISHTDFANGEPAISGDGRQVAYSRWWTDDRGRALVVHDRLTGSEEPIIVAPTGPDGGNSSCCASLSFDGRYIAFQTAGTWDPNAGNDVYWRDMRDGVVVRVSVSDTADPDQGSGDPAITSDGRSVAYSSRSPILVPGDTNGGEDVFLWRR